MVRGTHGLRKLCCFHRGSRRDRDGIIVQIASVTLGGGAPLLPRAIVAPPMKLLSATVYGEAFVELRYEVGRSDTRD